MAGRCTIAFLATLLLSTSCHPKETGDIDTSSDTAEDPADLRPWIETVSIHPVADGGIAGLGYWQYSVFQQGWADALRVDIMADIDGVWGESHELSCSACDGTPDNTWETAMDVVPLDELSGDDRTLYAADDQDEMTWMFTVFRVGWDEGVSASETWSSCVTTGKDPTLFQWYFCSSIEPE